MAENSTAMTAPAAHCGRCCTQIKNLSVVKGQKTIIHDINLHMHCGELTAVIGPNGGGKSTLLKAIIGEAAHKGEISFLNREGIKAKPLIGYLPQRCDFDPGSPVSIEDLFLARYKSLPIWLYSSRKKRKETLTILARVHAEHLIDRKLGELSGGEVQRVLLALALEPIPDILLLDEPVSGVDYSGRKLFYNMVSDLRTQYDFTILMVSHDIDLMKDFADQMVLLDGTILCQGQPEQVLKNNQAFRVFWNFSA